MTSDFLRVKTQVQNVVKRTATYVDDHRTSLPVKICDIQLVIDENSPVVPHAKTVLTPFKRSYISKSSNQGSDIQKLTLDEKKCNELISPSSSKGFTMG